MKVRMKVEMSGTLDGNPWPRRGGEVDIPDLVGAKLCAAGHAEPVTTTDVETTDDPRTTETRDPLDDLRADLEAAGVKVDKRWGEQRLRDELEAATAPEGAEEE